MGPMTIYSASLPYFSSTQRFFDNDVGDDVTCATVVVIGAVDFIRWDQVE